jgi:hypothetical protein
MYQVLSIPHLMVKNEIRNMNENVNENLINNRTPENTTNPSWFYKLFACLYSKDFEPETNNENINVNLLNEITISDSSRY